MSERNKIISILCCLSLIILFAGKADTFYPAGPPSINFGGNRRLITKRPIYDEEPRNYIFYPPAPPSSPLDFRGGMDEDFDKPSRLSGRNQDKPWKGSPPMRRQFYFGDEPSFGGTWRSKKRRVKNLRQSYDADSPDYHNYQIGNANSEDGGAYVSALGNVIYLPGMGWGDGYGNIGGNMRDGLGR